MHKGAKIGKIQFNLLTSSIALHLEKGDNKLSE